MSFFAVFMSIFSVLGAIDRIIGNKFGIGKEFEKGFMLLGTMSLSMIGMIIISPGIADLLSPVFGAMWETLHLDPSIIPASLFANDMGGAPLSVEVAVNENIGLFNALVVSSMMGCTISFNIPFSIGVVNHEKHNDMFLGMLCGIVTIPIGCFVAGFFTDLTVKQLLTNLLPLIIFSLIIAAGILFIPKVCIKVFELLGRFMKILITVGLILGLLKFLTGIEIIKGLATFEEGAEVCFNASAVMTGAFPFMYIVSKLVAKPLKKLGEKTGMNETSAFGFVSTLATNFTTFEMMNNMDRKGVVLNSAFAISASFTFAGHLAFTMAFDENYIIPMIVAKLVAGVAALLLAIVIFNRSKNMKEINKTSN